MQKLKEQGKLWCIYNVEKKDDVLFPQDAKPLITLSQDLVDFWHSTKVSCTVDSVLIRLWAKYTPVT